MNYYNGNYNLVNIGTSLLGRKNAIQIILLCTAAVCTIVNVAPLFQGPSEYDYDPHFGSFDHYQYDDQQPTIRRRKATLNQVQSLSVLWEDLVQLSEGDKGVLLHRLVQHQCAGTTDRNPGSSPFCDHNQKREKELRQQHHPTRQHDYRQSLQSESETDSNSSTNSSTTTTGSPLMFGNYDLLLPHVKGNITWKHKAKRHPLNFVHIPKTAGTSIVQAAMEANLTWGDCLFRQKIGTRMCPQPPKQPWPTKDFDANLDRVFWHVPIQHLPIHRLLSDTKSSETNTSHTETSMANTSATLFENPYDGYDLFAVVRNPYDRMVSEFYYRQCTLKKHPCHALKKGGATAAARLNKYIQISMRQMILAEPGSVDYYYKWGHYIPQYDFFYDHDNNKSNPQRMIEHVLHLEYLDEEFASLMQAYGLPVVLPPNKHKSRADQGAKLDVWDLTPATMRLIEAVYERDFRLGGYTFLSAVRNTTPS